MKQFYLLFVLLCLSGITMAQSNPQFANVSFTYERATCNSYQLSFHGSAATIDTSNAIADYSWYFGSGDSTYHGKDVSFSYQGPGTYTVWLMVRTVKGDTASTFRYVDVYQDSTSLFASIELRRGSIDSLVAFPRSATFGEYVYKWYWNDTVVQTNTNGILTSMPNGTFKVAVENSLGCISVSVPLTYRHRLDSTQMEFYWWAINCDPQLIQFYSYSGGADLTQVWNFGDNQGWVGSNPEHRYDSTGAYFVTLTLYDGPEYIGTLTRQIYVSGQQQWSVTIQPQFGGNGVQFLTAYTTPANAKIVWNTGDSVHTIPVTVSGKYVVKVFDQCGNVRAADSLIAAAPNQHVAHNSSDAALSFNANVAKAYPNPSSGLVNLQFANPLVKKVIVSVQNQQGQVLYTRTTTQQSQQLDLSTLPKGYYLIVISDGIDRKVQPLLLQ
ncbi:PKD domain-containing protein [Chitinophaga sp. S165]|uniref:PKD domain-containing protein n=1 Tax=Chitinophaga sp. S165 TaxID=2135462 RepID=UPI000D71C57D|nr:PKD domain-containing protein [Chitinophaga sp. S165]PWV49733.1 putative secreted protein (Por secretion system target) [Chitinophaga sp. S165]